jgi:thiamine-phosphate pyrophosphorylase
MNRLPEGAKGEPSLYLIAGRAQAPAGEFLDRVRAALEAGVHLVQLREKAADLAEVLELGRDLKALCRIHDRPLVVNDDAALAARLGAHGLHVGQDDLAPEKARRRVGETCFIGLSTHSVAQARAAFADQQVDAIGIGPVFPTSTKEAGTPLGPEIWRTITALDGAKPAWAIGGISSATLPALVAAGCRRIAVSSAILQAPDVGRAVSRLLAILEP